MSSEWKPAEYRDEFRAKLSKVIQERMKHKGARVEKPEAPAEETSDKVVDLMAVLRKSLEAKKGPKRHPGTAARRSARSSRPPQRKRA
jgi:DNA end-binding protein Ku